MAEHEVAKHTKVIYKAWRDPNKSWKHKAGEIAIEILIIVFAISLSLLVERWREQAHERTVEQQFLIGLKKDLQADIEELQQDSTSYVTVKEGWAYFYRVGTGMAALTGDSLERYQWTLMNRTIFNPNNSRFEALKSSGEFGVIENDSLQNMILDLYQNKIAALHLSTGMFNELKDKQLVPYLFENLKVNSDGTSNLAGLTQQPRMQNYLNYRQTINEVLERYSMVLQQSRKIVGMIDKQYGLQ